MPYRYGILNSAGWNWIDHQTGRVQTFSMPGARLAEACFVPRKKGAPEGDGYLIGVADQVKENGRSDVVIIATHDVTAGPIATMHMPYKVVGQVHGLWVEGWQLPQHA